MNAYNPKSQYANRDLESRIEYKNCPRDLLVPAKTRDYRVVCGSDGFWVLHTESGAKMHQRPFKFDTPAKMLMIGIQRNHLLSEDKQTGGV